MLHRWKQEYLQNKEHAFPGKGHMKPHEEEIFKLNKKIADLEEDQAILKKGLAIFSSLKKELVHLTIFYSKNQARQAKRALSTVLGLIDESFNSTSGVII